MERSQAIKAIIILMFFAYLTLFLNNAISHADQVYNFYFNPDGGSGSTPIQQSPKVQPAVEQVQQQDAPTIKPREVQPANAYLPKSKVEWNDDYSLFRVGTYFFGSFNKISGTSEGRASQLTGTAGATLALQVFPLKNWGLFGEGITDKDFKDFAFAAGTELIPFHLAVFGYEDLLALGGEIGWSNYQALVINNGIYLGNYPMKWFAGAKVHVKLTDQLYTDIGLRKSLGSSLWTANAGISLHF